MTAIIPFSFEGAPVRVVSRPATLGSSHRMWQTSWKSVGPMMPFGVSTMMKRVRILSAPLAACSR